jgi:hypothetical protein
MKKRFKFLEIPVLALAVSLALGGCVSYPEHEKMNIRAPENSSRSVLNLRNTSNLSASLLRQSERIMKNGFLDTSTDEYGYFSIWIEEDGFYSDMSMPMVILASGTLFVTYPVWAVMGIPTEKGEATLHATLYIYDSNHALIKSYTESTEMVKYAGLYYSGNMTKKAAKYYTKLFESILASAQMQSAEINSALRAAGPITAEKEKIYQAQRAGIEAANTAARAAAVNIPAPTTNNYSYSEPQTTSPSSSQPDTGQRIAETIQRAFVSPIENGTYKISGRPEEIRFTGIAKSGMLSFKDASGSTASGSYSIDGDRITMQILGRTFFYTVTSKTSFSGNGEQWFRSGF